jgi:uncharacterized membrane protein YjgN (DUF898 family)
MATSVPPAGAGVASAASSTAPSAASTYPFAWSGSPWELAPLAALNAVLTVLTLGIYNFWGRTELRRRTWSSVRLLGDPLVYHGTPTELLRGFLLILAILLLPLFLIGTAVVIFYGQASSAFAGYQMGLILVFYPLLTAVALYRARRYRLQRTSWRGIRGTMEGSSTLYAGWSWATALAYPLTLGWIHPFRAILLQRRLVGETRLGSERLAFSGTSATLYGRFALLWFGTIILVIVTFGTIGSIIAARAGGNPAANPFWWMRIRAEDIYVVIATIFGALFLWSLMSSFYYAKLYNHVASTTTFVAPATAGREPVRFALDVRGPGLIWLFLTNTLITYGTLYILRPVATARSLRYFVERFRVVGPFDPSALGQLPGLLDAKGEGLAQAFDVDAF